MARTEKVIMKNMCMVFSENRVLVQDKTDDDYSGITFPGGHVERGESFTDVKERYYNNKVAKIRKKLASLSTTVDKEDLLGCLDGYCRKLWTESYIQKHHRTA